MTDRELLEKAAKAAGIELRFHDDGTAYADTRSPGYWAVWNPLADDGDALRLAVKLRLVVEVGAEATLVYRDDPDICELHEADAFAATRRAIVRAAAAIAGD